MKHKLTKQQIQSMHEHLSKLTYKDKSKKSTLKFLYHIDTPKDVYVKYLSYSVEPDNSIFSEEITQCIKPDGSKMDCAEQFENLRQKMEFESGLLEIDLDSRGNIMIL
tara:strand:+ start:405 stop:728 length:324 start_codon:yes stop_codon:yes gene_type:complete